MGSRTCEPTYIGISGDGDSLPIGLGQFCTPSARIPRGSGVLATVVLCGFLLHDLPAWLATRRVLPPGATIAFMLFGLGVVISEKLRTDLSRWPVAGRALVSLAYLGGCVALMLAIVLGLVAR